MSGERVELPDDSWDMDTMNMGRRKRERDESYLPDTRVRKKIETEPLSLRPQYHREAKVRSALPIITKTVEVPTTGLERQLIMSPSATTRETKQSKN